jgi:hypothetical protein
VSIESAPEGEIPPRADLVSACVWIAFGVLVAVVVTCNVLALPDYGDARIESQRFVVTKTGMLYTHPLGRVFEFTLGIFVAGLWRKHRDRRLPGNATAWEIGAVAACIGMLMLVPYVAYLKPWVGAGTLWFAHAGATPAFALLIYVVALGHGALSRLLRVRVLVLLGEVSYSLYLVHQQLLGWFEWFRRGYPAIPAPLAIGAYLAGAVLLAYLMWRVIELPGRRLLIGKRPIHWASATAAARSVRGPVVAALALAGLLWGVTHMPSLPSAAPVPVPEASNVRFGTIARLDSLELACMHGSLEVRMAWSPLPGDDGRPFNHSVHLLDAAGAIVGNYDYARTPWPAGTAPTALRNDDVHVPLEDLAKARDLTLGMYDPKDVALLPVDRGPRPAHGRELQVPLPACED